MVCKRSEIVFPRAQRILVQYLWKQGHIYARGETRVIFMSSTAKDNSFDTETSCEGPLIEVRKGDVLKINTKENAAHPVYAMSKEMKNYSVSGLLSI